MSSIRSRGRAPWHPRGRRYEVTLLEFRSRTSRTWIFVEARGQTRDDRPNEASGWRCHRPGRWAPPFDHRPELQLSLIHISEPTRLGMISYAVFCLKKKKRHRTRQHTIHINIYSH